MRFAILTAVWGYAVLCGYAQTPDRAPRPSFEVASVKPHGNSADTNMSINFAPGGQLNCTNVSLRLMILYAYELSDYQVVNAPGWADTERYDIVAKPSPEDAGHEPPQYSNASQTLNRQRTRVLLEERFGLKTHQEQREMSVYSLIVAKGGPKLHPTESTAPLPQMSWNQTRVICKKVSMERFAKVLLASNMNRYVIDNTGLTGEYDFRMDFRPDEPAHKEGELATAPTGPNFTQALEEQLGLKLVTAKGPVPFLAIDHAERPSAN